MNLLSWVKSVFHYGFWSSVVLLLIMYTSLSVSIFPPFAILVIFPILLFAVILIEPVRSYPHKLISFLTLSWLFLSVVWPYFVVYHVPGLFDLRPTRALLALLAIVWLFYFFKSKDLNDQIGRYKAVSKLFFIFLWFFVITKVWGVAFSGAPGDTIGLFIKEVIEIMLPAIILLSLLRDREDVEKVVNVLLWMGGVVIAVGLLESRIQANVLATYLPASMLSAQDYVTTALSDKIRGEYRLQSLFGHPLVYAQFVILVLPFIVYRVISTHSYWVKAAMWILLIAAAIVLWGTGSRAIFPAVIAEIIALLLIIYYKVVVTNRASFIGWLYVTLMPVGAIAMVAVVIKAKRFIMGQSDSEYLSTQARIEMWSRGFGIIESDPIGALFGFGLYRAAIVIDWQVAGEYTIDSYFLSLLLETGILGFLAFFFLAGYAFIISVNTWKRSGYQDHVSIAFIVSISGFLMVAFILSLTHILHVFYVLVAVLIFLFWLSKKA